MDKIIDAIGNFLSSTGVGTAIGSGSWKWIVMVIIACVLCYLAIAKKFEPLLLLPIAIGMLLTNLPGAGVFHEEFFAGGHIHWNLIGGAEVTKEIIASIAHDMAVFGEDFVNTLVNNVSLNVSFPTDVTELADKITYLVETYPIDAYDYLVESGIIAKTPIRE